ncbi:MAG TPA: hypothetical protein VE993_09300 [Stellaceae bacterium]|nr:hypothetical protein [Stellaceae bacterium]
MTRTSPAPHEHGSRRNPDDDRGDGPNRVAALLGLVLIALLVAAAVYLVQALHRESQLEDCLMSRRTNCAPIAVPAR